eukprot:3703146-Rhodomonas_salina.2
MPVLTSQCYFRNCEAYGEVATVLLERMVLPAYAVSGTDIAFAAPRRDLREVQRLERARRAIAGYRSLLRSYALPMQCPVLTYAPMHSLCHARY